MAPQRYGREVGQHEDARQCARGTGTDAERTRQGEEGSQRLGYLIQARDLRAGLEAQAPLDEARVSVSGQGPRGKADSDGNGVSEKRARQGASQYGGDETAPGLVVAEQAASIRQRHPGVDGRCEAVSEEISSSPRRRVRGTEQHEGLEPVRQHRVTIP